MIIPKHIEFVEVGPRDGLQNEAVLVSTDDKLALINRAIAAGARRIEATSFVNPKRVPQMADAEDVCAGLPDRGDVTFIGLVMNLRGAGYGVAVRLKAEQLRILLSLLVLAVSLKIALDLLIRPSELYSVIPGMLP